jgi:hypothetical protein
VPRHEFFGEGFARLQLRGFGARPRDGEAAPLKLVGESGGKRRFPADNREFDLFRVGKRGERGHVRRPNRHAARECGDGVAAGRAVEFDALFGSSLERVAERMFAPARADDHNLHRQRNFLTPREVN